MTRRWSAGDLAQVASRMNQPILVPNAHAKYGNTKVEYHGQKFDSEGELKAYKAFKLQELGGAIRSVIRQVSLPMQGSNRRIRLDFVVVENDGRVRWIDFKGFATPEWLSKRDQVQQAYGLTIEVIT